MNLNLNLNLKDKTAIQLFKIGAIRFENTRKFHLKSGKNSCVYIDLRKTYEFPSVMKDLCSLIWEEFGSDEFDTVCGVPYGAIPYASYISFKKNLKLIISRKEKKKHGSQKEIEGNTNCKKCFLIEDVITSGGSLNDTVETLVRNGMKRENIFSACIFSRGNKDILPYIFHINDVLDLLFKNNFISDDTKNNVLNELGECRSRKILFDLVESKKSNLILSADLENPIDILNLVKMIGAYIVAVKIHIDTINFSDLKFEIFITTLRKYAENNHFLIIEDRKFSDISNTLSKQISGGIFRISDWADMVTAHAIQGEKSINEFRKAKIDVILIAEMSTSGNLISETYTKNVINLATRNSDCIVGIVTQTIHANLVCFTPGISLSKKTDNLDQTYRSPESKLVSDKQLFIVGRDIYDSNDPCGIALKYLDIYRKFKLVSNRP